MIQIHIFFLLSLERRKWRWIWWISF